MDNPEFNKHFRNLNPEQRLAVETIEGPVMVIAGPGTGKTQTLTLRIANILLKTQINPENILALTFTESGVAEMRKRLVSIIGTPAYRVAIHTFHGFCNKLIQDNPEDFKELMAANNITELEQIEIMEGILERLDLKEIKPYVDPLFYTSPALRAIEELKKEGITGKEFNGAVEKQQEDFTKIDDLYNEKGKYKGNMKGKYQRLEKQIKKNEELVKVYEEYEKELRKRKVFDFSDMLLFVIKKMQEDEEFLLRAQERYHYFLVDEHQDTNAAQNKIVELLASFFENPNLFVVGDEKQAIFRFQGASLENFLYFRHLYPNALLINLRKNYRSTQAILDAAASLISENTQIDFLAEFPVQLESSTDLPGEKVKISEISNAAAEYQLVAKEVEQKISSGVDPSDITILARKNISLLPFTGIFETRKIPFVLESEQNITEDLTVQKFLLLLRSIAELGNDELLIKAMHLDFLGIAPLDIYKIRRLSVDKGVHMWELLEKRLHHELELRTKKEIDDVVEKLEEWKILVENETADTAFIEILNASELLAAIMNKKNGLNILDKFARLYDEVQQQLARNPGFLTKDFLRYLDLLKKHSITLRKPQAVKREGVRLMTTHRAKGLEFEYVYIVGVTDKDWGSPGSKKNLFKLPWDYMKRLDETPLNGDEVEDERRLFYVALTRAKKEAMVSYALVDGEGREMIPSRFVHEIEESFRQSASVGTFEKEFSDNKQMIFTPHPKRTKADIEEEFLESKNYFSELFEHRGMSVSALNNYLDCPWKYFFRNLLTLPEVKGDHQKYGTAVHRTLNRFIIAREKREVNEKDLLDMFADAMADEAFLGNTERKWRERGEEALHGYYKENISNWKNNMQSEKNIYGVKLADGVVLNGKLDMIEPLGEKYVRVYDFKTGKSKSRNEIEGKTKNSKGNYKRQLVFYKILLDRYHDGKAVMREGVLDFVEPSATGVYKKEIFDITGDEVKELEETIIKVAGEIKNLEFWDKRCDEKDCEYCKLRNFIGR